MTTTTTVRCPRCLQPMRLYVNVCTGEAVKFCMDCTVWEPAPDPEAIFLAVQRQRQEEQRQG